MGRLSGLDGAFLAFESPTTYLHIAGVLVFDPTEVPGGVGFSEIREMVAGRIWLIPPFRSRMVEVAFGLQHPSMVDDPDFDINFHVRRARLPQPGGPSELAALVGEIVGRPLDRGRPLWEFHVVEGLDHGHVALVSKVHHSIIDGVSGADIMAVFFDLSAYPTGPTSGSAPHQAMTSQTDPDATSKTSGLAAVDWDIGRLRDVIGSLPRQTNEVARTLSNTARTVRNLNSRNRQQDGSSAQSWFDAPRTSINRAISSHRRVEFAELPLADIHRVRKVFGGTVNDVVLTAVSGALRTFFSERKETLDRSLVAMVPISMRSAADHDKLGNQVSAMLVSLATEVEDLAARLQAISKGMRLAKEQQQKVGSDVVSQWAQLFFPAVATQVSKLVTNLRVFDRLSPPFNVIVSNIPGPDVPLFMAGARMVAMYPIGPIVEGVGVNVTVFSYLDTMYVGVQACWDLVPDVEVIANGMVDALSDLVKEANRRDRPVPWWHTDQGELTPG